MQFLLSNFKKPILWLTQLAVNLKHLGGKGENEKETLKELVYGEQIIFQMVVIFKVSPMNCGIQVQVSSGALRVYGAALLIAGVREGGREVCTGARSAVTVPISTV